MTKQRPTLPDDFLQWPAAEQRRYIVRDWAKRFEAGHPDAWYELLTRAVTADPDIPEPTKAKLRARLIKTAQGSGTIDPLSPERRAAEYQDAMIFSDLHHAGGSLKEAAPKVAAALGVSVATVRRAYERHMERWPQCQRLDGRRKRKKPQALLIRG